VSVSAVAYKWAVAQPAPLGCLSTPLSQLIADESARFMKWRDEQIQVLADLALETQESQGMRLELVIGAACFGETIVVNPTPDGLVEVCTYRET